MKYFEVKFTLSPYSTDACDVLSAMAGEVGFESFEETDNGLLGYVQQSPCGPDFLYSKPLSKKRKFKTFCFCNLSVPL